MAKRVAYAIASPLIPVVRLVRIVSMLASSGRYSFLLPRILPALVTCLAADGLGELVGYVAGPGSSPEKLGAIEFNRRRFMNSRDIEELDGRASWTPDEGMEPAPQPM